MKRCRFLAAAGLGIALAASFAWARAEGKGEKYGERLVRARRVVEELLAMPDDEMPRALLRRCRCIVVIPGVIKAALGWGGRHGRGIVSCRDDAGRWSPPSFVNISGGSFGLQIGVDRTDLVLFIMGEKGARSLVQSEFTLGGAAAAAAGPVGRSAEGSTDIKLDAEIYAYAKSRGLFAGLSIEGARLNAAEKAIRGFYGAAVSPEAILFAHRVPRLPAEATQFLAVLPTRD